MKKSQSSSLVYNTKTGIYLWLIHCVKVITECWPKTSILRLFNVVHIHLMCGHPKSQYLNKQNILPVFQTFAPFSNSTMSVIQTFFFIFTTLSCLVACVRFLFESRHTVVSGAVWGLSSRLFLQYSLQWQQGQTCAYWSRKLGDIYLCLVRQETDCGDSTV